METKKIQALEAALRSLSYDTLVKVKENIAREAANREQHKLGLDQHPHDKAEQNGDESYEEQGKQEEGVPSSSTSSLAQLNYNISKMTSPPPMSSFSSSIASSMPPSVSSSF